MFRTTLIKTSWLFLIASLLLAACTSAPTQPANPAPSQPPVEAAAPTETPAPPTQPAATTTPEITQPPTAAALTFTDGLGRAVTLPGPAQRIVSMAPSNTEILYAVGAGDQVIGRDDFSDYPAEAQELPTIGGNFSGYNNEAIVALQPDLVLVAEINTPEQVQALEDLGLAVYYLKNPLDLEGMYANLETIATMTGHTTETEALVSELKERVAAVDSALQEVEGRPKVFYELDITDPNAPYTAGPGNFIDLLIDMAGGQNIGSVLDSPWAQISAEELLVQDPEVIVLGDSNYGVTPETVAQRPGWGQIQAVKDGRVYPFDDNLVSRPGPRWVDGLESMAKLLHPKLFQ